MNSITAAKKKQVRLLRTLARVTTSPDEASTARRIADAIEAKYHLKRRK